MDADGVLALYDRHARELLGFFARRTHDPQLSLDLLSETFLAAFEHRAQCRAGDERAAAAWLYRIAANRLTGQHRRGAAERRAAARLAGSLRALSAGEVSAIERLAAAAEPGALTVALERLSREQRDAVRVRVLDERSYAEASRELGISEQAVRARVSRGLRALRRAVDASTTRSGDGTP